MDGEALGIGIGNTIYNSLQAQKNRDAQANQNFLDRKQQEKIYGWQRDDAREDWANQNAYNHPTEQMNRLRQAGLSPHLVYGKGADTTAGAIRSYSGEAPNQQAPQTEWSKVADNMLTGFDMKIKQEQTDNINADTQNKEKDLLVKDATIASALQNTARSKFDLEQAERIKDQVVDKVMLGNEKTKAEIDKIIVDTEYTLDQNERAKLANSANVAKTLQEINNLKIRLLQDQEQTKKTTEEINVLKQQQEILKDEALIKKAEAALNQQGIQKSDPWYARALMQAAISIRNGIKWIWKP